MVTTSPRPFRSATRHRRHAAIHHLRALVHQRGRHAALLSGVAARRRRPARSWSCSTAATSTRAAGKTSSTRSRRKASGSSPGTRAATGDPRSARRRGALGLLRTGCRAVRRGTVGDRRRADGRIAVVAHSVGAVIVAAWIHDYAPRCARRCWRRRPSASGSTSPGDPGAAAGADAAAS